MARKRKSGSRTKSGRLSRAYATEARDHGTPELQTKRQQLVGPSGDPNHAATVPGILCAHGHIDTDQRDAALRYAVLRCALYGTPWPRTPTYQETTDAHVLRLKRAFEAMLAKLTPDQRTTIANTALANPTTPPIWAQRQQHNQTLRPHEHEEYSTLLAGLNALLDRSNS